jgi:hypothetical protein
MRHRGHGYVDSQRRGHAQHGIWQRDTPCKATTGGGPYPVLQVRTRTREFSLIAISQVIEDDGPAVGTNLVSDDPTFKE